VEKNKEKKEEAIIVSGSGKGKSLEELMRIYYALLHNRK